MGTRDLEITVNGRSHRVRPEPDRTLLVVLREELGLTGAKYGCGEGACGACTVLMDGAPVRSCVTAVAEADGRSVTTVEGLASDGLHPVQRAFLDEGAMQCGYCTPGMVMSAVALLQNEPHPDRARIVKAMNGNLCRCAGYTRIVRAIQRAAAGEVEAAEPTGKDDGAPLTLPRPASPWDLTEAEDRDWFDVLPPGLVVVLPPGELPGAWTAGGGAWIHVGEDGTVTAFTGKADVGQDNRTALALIVGAELGLPPTSVRVVMGDTDVCPWDMGTFGSRSIPDAGPTLAATAAGTRAHLLRLAAERLEVDAADLSVAGCRIGVRGTDRSVGFGELVEGLRRVETVGGPAPKRFGQAGGAAGKLQAEETVTGRRRFPTDVSRPGMLHGLVLRPPAYGATLRSLDLSAAAALPGATTVEEDGFVGVAAPDPDLALRAVEAIKAEWNLTEQPGEEDLEEHLRSHPVEAEGWAAAHLEETGDVDRALEEAEVRLDATYTAAYIQHVPLETRVAVAEWEGRRLTVWTGTQRPFGVREQVARELGVPEHDVRVIVPTTGTGFGGKHSGEAAVAASRLARAAGAPVKVRWSRQEELTWAYFRPAAVIDVSAGVSRDGHLTAWGFTNINSGAAGIDLPYDVEHTRIRYQPAESPLPQGSYRGLAATANAFARESHVDELAHAIGMDPVEMRLRNLSDKRLAEVLRTAVDRAGWEGRASLGDGRGLGVALGFEKDGRVATTAEVQAGSDGSIAVTRIVTAFDCGAVIDPDNLRNQVEGATIMGLGGALFEAMRFREGRILNPSLNSYRVPRFADVPEIDVVLIDRKGQPSAGAGETPIIAVAPAIANAIFAATGRRIRSMPLAPDGRMAGTAVPT